MHHKDVGIVSFTGSTATGRKVSEACASAFKHCHLEMGGKNVIMVMDDADLDLAVDGAIWGGFGTTGQRCTAASRVILHKQVYREFADRFVSRAKASRSATGSTRACRWARHQPSAAREDRELREDRAGRGGEAAHRRPPAGQGAAREGLLPRAHRLRRLRPEDAHLLRGGLRAGGEPHPRRLARRGHRGRQRGGLRALGGHLHPRHQQGLPRHARHVHRHLLRERAHHRRGDAPSAGRRTPATAIARHACRRSTSSPSGSPSTSITAAPSSAPRSTTTPSRGAPP